MIKKVISYSRTYCLLACCVVHRCSRDMWFEVPLPFFLRDHVYGLGWERVAVGAMLAVRRVLNTSAMHVLLLSSCL